MMLGLVKLMIRYEIVDSSLHFINDLVRHLLDMQRASSSKQVTIEEKAAHLRDDVQPRD